MIIPLDIYFYNSLAQGVAVLVIMVMVFVLRREVQSRFVVIGLEMLLLTIGLRRLDEIGFYFGIDILDRVALAFLAWIAITILFLSFLKAWERRITIAHIVNRIKTEPKYHEALQEDDEALQRVK